MANYFVRSTDGNDADNGTTWALAKATLTGGLAVAAAGDTIYVSDNHSESTAAAITLTSPGTAASWVRILCVDDAGDPASPTTLATSAIVATTGAASNISFAGFAYCHGITFNAGNSSNQADIRFTSVTPWHWHLKSCNVVLNNTSTSSRIQIGSGTVSSDAVGAVFEDTPMTFGSTSQFTYLCGVDFEWFGASSTIGGTVPTVLFTPLQGFPSIAFIHGVDLSAAGSGKSLVDQSQRTTGRILFANCKLGASVGIVTGTPDANDSAVIEISNCDSGDTNYRNERYTYHGSQTMNTTVYRDSGASDGTTSYGWTVLGARIQKHIASFRTSPIVGFINSTGSKTFTISYIHTGASALQDDEIWLELEYLGSGSFPISTITTDRKSTPLSTAANQTADTSSDWDNGVTARANTTAYSLNDIRRAATPNGKIFIVTTAGTSAGSEPAGFTSAADGDSVTDDTVVWRCMRREKVNTTVTVNEKGTFIAWVRVATTTSLVIDPLVQIT